MKTEYFYILIILIIKICRQYLKKKLDGCFDDKNLIDNISHLLQDLRKSKPSAAKGTYIKQVVLSTTMGPGIKIDINTIDSGE